MCSSQSSSVSGPLGADNPSFVSVSCCHAAYCTEWALGSEACENPTLAHLETVSCVCVCVQEKDGHRDKKCTRVCVWGRDEGGRVKVETPHRKQPPSVLDGTERFFIILLFH